MKNNNSDLKILNNSFKKILHNYNILFVYEAINLDGFIKQLLSTYKYTYSEELENDGKFKIEKYKINKNKLTYIFNKVLDPNNKVRDLKEYITNAFRTYYKSSIIKTNYKLNSKLDNRIMLLIYFINYENADNELKDINELKKIVKIIPVFYVKLNKFNEENIIIIKDNLVKIIKEININFIIVKLKQNICKLYCNRPPTVVNLDKNNKIFTDNIISVDFKYLVDMVTFINKIYYINKLNIKYSNYLKLNIYSNKKIRKNSSVANFGVGVVIGLGMAGAILKLKNTFF